MADAWTRRRGESSAAFDAFQHYLNEGSIDAAYARAKPDQNQIGKRAPAQWFQWSAKYEWVSRAAAYADHLAEQDRLLVEERRREQRELEWGIVKKGLEIVRDALPNAEQFITRKTTTIRGTPSLMDADGKIVRPGTPDREIVTLQFDVSGLSAASERFGKQGRLANEQPTERIELSGAALDAAIERIALGLAGLGDSGEAQAAGAPATDEPAGDGQSDRPTSRATGGDEAL